jgi:hypothetical protein
MRDIIIPMPSSGSELNHMLEALWVEERDYHFALRPTMTPLFRTNVVPGYAHRLVAFIASRCVGVQSVQ